MSFLKTMMFFHFTIQMHSYCHLSSSSHNNITETSYSDKLDTSMYLPVGRRHLLINWLKVTVHLPPAMAEPLVSAVKNLKWRWVPRNWGRFKLFLGSLSSSSHSRLTAEFKGRYNYSRAKVKWKGNAACCLAWLVWSNMCITFGRWTTMFMCIK